MAKVLQTLVGDASVLILIPGKNEGYDSVVRSVNNLPSAKLLMANYLNIRDLFSFDKVIMPLAALEVIESYLGDER
jgi:large subunit ribosomal protein L4